MINIAITLLGLAMQLLLAVQNNPSISEWQRTNAVNMANSAIAYATQVIAGRVSTPVSSNAIAATSTSAVTASSSVATTTVAIATSSIASSTVSALLNGNVPNPLTFYPNSRNQDIGSFLISVSGPEAVSIATATISVGTGAEVTLQNIKLLVNRIQWGPLVASSTSGGNYSFQGAAPFTISPGSSIRVDVNADILSSGKGMSPATTFQSCQGWGMISSSTMTCGSVTGQKIVVGTPTLMGLINTAVPVATTTLGVNGQQIGSYYLSASLAEDINVSSFTVSLGRISGLQNLKLHVNGSQYGQTQANPVSGGYYTFNGAPINIPAGSETTKLDLYADVSENAVSAYPATTLSGCSGLSAISNSYVTCNYPTRGQDLSTVAPSS